MYQVKCTVCKRESIAFSTVWNKCHMLKKSTKQTRVTHKHGKNTHKRGREWALVKKGQKVGESSIWTWRRKEKMQRMVAYPVDQSLPLSVKVLIGEHTFVCAQMRGGGGGASSLLCVHCKNCLYSLLISAHVDRGKNNIPVFLLPLFSIACQACFGVNP